jgi:hypothetical protein
MADRREPVAADAWLDGHFERDAAVREHSRAMPNYNRVLTIPARHDCVHVA